MTSRLLFVPSMSAALAMCLLGPLLVGWDETVATHYGMTLRADAWGSAGQLGLMLAAVVFLLFGTLVFAGRGGESRPTINALGLWTGAIFLALETYTFSRPRFEDVAPEVVLAGVALFLLALTATVGIARRSYMSVDESP